MNSADDSQTRPGRSRDVRRKTYIHLVFPLFLNSVRGLLPLLARLYATRDSADLDTLEITRKINVETEGVVGVDVSAWWVLLQDLVFRASQRLKISR